MKFSEMEYTHRLLVLLFVLALTVVEIVVATREHNTAEAQYAAGQQRLDAQYEALRKEHCATFGRDPDTVKSGYCNR